MPVILFNWGMYLLIAYCMWYFFMVIGARNEKLSSNGRINVHVLQPDKQAVGRFHVHVCEESYYKFLIRIEPT